MEVTTIKVCSIPGPSAAISDYLRLHGEWAHTINACAGVIVGMYLLPHVGNNTFITDDEADSDDYTHETNILTLHCCPILHCMSRVDQSAVASEPLTACALFL